MPSHVDYDHTVHTAPLPRTYAACTEMFVGNELLLLLLVLFIPVHQQYLPCIAALGTGESKEEGPSWGD